LGLYWPEVTLLAGSFLTPVAAWFVLWPGSLSMLARSGSIMVLLAALAEFYTLGRNNRKHIRNAKRLFTGQMPLGFSHMAGWVGFAALVAAILGTVMWGYADCWSAQTQCAG
jgi:hypothetical protein